MNFSSRVARHCVFLIEITQNFNLTRTPGELRLRAGVLSLTCALNTAGGQTRNRKFSV